MDACAVPKGPKADRDANLEIAYTLKTVPRFGARFSFKLLDAPASGAEMAVFSNGVMTGLVHLWGTAGTNSPYKMGFCVMVVGTAMQSWR